MKPTSTTMTDFEDFKLAEASQEKAEILKFERDDWALFRTIEGLQQRAGVPKEHLRRLIIKELADNGLDLNATVKVGEDEGGFYHVEDDGPGIDPTMVATLFSIKRPMISTKLLRLPTRGALGNGLRVVAGGVLSGGGSLAVMTRNRRLDLRPERDGSTSVIRDRPIDHPRGTRVEINLGTLPSDPLATAWAKVAIAMAGSSYAGNTSPHWYDAATFHELLYASGSRPVRDLIARFDGCSGSKAGEIVAAARLGRATCETLTRQQAERLLVQAQNHSRPVNPTRLIGFGPVEGKSYACQRGHLATPYLVEAWAQPAEEMGIVVCVNRTPVTGRIVAARDKRDIDLFGCGLAHTVATAPKDKHFLIKLNVITPFMPITSDGKAPDLKVFLDPISKAASSAVRKAHIPTRGDGKNQKSVVLENLDDVIATVSTGGEYRFNQRQLLYALRPIVRQELGANLTTNNFAGIITDYETEHGEIEGMYREPRGTITHPHRNETITLGTLMVEKYERPPWLFNKLVYIEKEGANEALKAEQWGERHDCTVMSSKGFSTRAARDLIDKLAEHDEPITVFCVHDADASGTMIYQTLQQETKARGARKITIINLGLERDEAEAMGLEVEDVDESSRIKPVADYVSAEDRDWYQTHRVELNAMTTLQFIEWLDGKMAGYDKLIPPADVLERELADRIEDKVRAALTERILREARVDEQVASAIAAIAKPTTDELAKGIAEMFEREPSSEWRDYIEAAAVENTCEP